MEYVIATLLMALVGWIVLRARQAAYVKGDEQGCVRGIAIGERNIIAEVRRDEQLLRRFQRIPQLPAGYSMIETRELRQLQALREQYLALPSSTEGSVIKGLPRRAVA